MARIFLSHSSRDNDRALAFSTWLAENGWDDVFLDIDPERGLSPGERWQQALKAAAGRCEAVVCLVSPAWLESRWCLAEFLLAKQLGKRIFPVLIEPVALDRLPPEMSENWQVVDLVADPDAYARIREGLTRAGLDPDSFVFPEGRRPYPGLAPLTEQDAAIFFGREAQLVRCLDRIRAAKDKGVDRFLLILGASGSGKSSFLRAGLWPRLERDYRAFFPLPTIRPERGVIEGTYGLLSALELVLGDTAGPFRDAADLPATRSDIRRSVQEPGGLARLIEAMSETLRHTVLLGSGAKPSIVLAIDQFEEFFGDLGQKEAGAFATLLARTLAAAPSLFVIAAMRSDAYPRFQADPVFGEVGHEPFGLSPIAPVHFRRIIEGPAELARPKLELDPRLVAALLRGTEDEEFYTAGGQMTGADVLPLLAFTLERLYRKHGASGRLTLDDCVELGGISGALTTAIDEAVAQGQADGRLPTEPDETAKLLRDVFIPHLVAASASGAFVRRIAKLDEIPEASHPIVDLLVESRILVKDRRRLAAEEADVVEIAHEAILREWPLLAAGLEESGALLKWSSAIAAPLKNWRAASDLGKEDYMLTGPPLSEGEYWLARRAGEFSPEARAFVEQSISRSYGRDVDRARGAARMTNMTFAAFVAISLLVLFGASSITQKDLFLGNPVIVPIINSQMNLFQFLGMLPLVLVVFHFWVLSQHAALVNRLRALGDLMTEREREEYTHLDTRRFDVDTYLFAQSLAGPPFGGGLQFAVQVLLLIALFLLPLAILLYVQAVAIALHATGVTWSNRSAVAIDVVLLAAYAPRLLRLGSRAPEQRKWWRVAAGEVLVYLLVPVALFYSLFIATIPGEPLDKHIAAWPGITRLFPPLTRNLTLTDTDLVVDREVVPGQPTLNLRNRDLRFARLDRSDLRQADLTGADLSGATLQGADLRGARLGCGNETKLLLLADRGAAECAVARNTNFRGARLSRAYLNGLDAERASFEEASLEDTSLRLALLNGASFVSARLDAAVLTGGVEATGANFLIASLLGADLTGAKLIGADFSSARLTAAMLDHARLQGAHLKDADLEAVSLKSAHLEAADLSGAAMAGADLTGASLWATLPPVFGDNRLLVARDLRIRPPADGDNKTLSAMLPSKNTRAGRALHDTLAPLFDAARRQAWSGSPDRQAWDALTAPFSAHAKIGAGVPYTEPGSLAARFTTHLSRLACDPRWPGGAVAAGVARLALADDFFGDATAIARRLTTPDCAPGRELPRNLTARLRALAAGAPGVLGATAAPDSACHNYAALAVARQKENDMLRCGFTGPVWSANYTAHLAWCQSVPPDHSATETQRRAREMEACRSR